MVEWRMKGRRRDLRNGREEEEMWTGIIGGNDRRCELATMKKRHREDMNNDGAMKETIKKIGFRCSWVLNRRDKLPLSKLKKRK